MLIPDGTVQVFRFGQKLGHHTAASCDVGFWVIGGKEIEVGDVIQKVGVEPPKMFQVRELQQVVKYHAGGGRSVYASLVTKANVCSFDAVEEQKRHVTLVSRY